MSKVKTTKLLSLTLLLSMFIFAPLLTRASSATSQSTVPLNYLGTASPVQSDATNAPDNGNTLEFGPSLTDTQIPQTGGSAPHVPADHIPMPSPTPIAASNPGLVLGFNALSHRNQRLAGTGIYANTQFSLEPPDQGLAIGNGYVVEAINAAFRVFSASSGTALTGTTALNQFFKVNPEVNRITSTFGNFTSDPKVYFDTNTGKFFLTMVELDRVNATGAFAGRSNVLIAVSQTGNPTGMWNLFSFDVTDDGSNGTPSHPNCPCFGDQPLIGADGNGFYISTNEFTIPGFGGAFNGPQIYAISKTALASAPSGSLPTVHQFNAGALPTPDVGGVWYSVQPATTPPGGTYATNTEFFLSALQFFLKPHTDNRIAVWALTGTDALNGGSGPLTLLSPSIVASEVYGQPGAATQQKGPTPLGTALKEKFEFLASNDDRMNQVVYANGMLWAGVNTVVQVSDFPTTVGVAWFIVSPTVSGGAVSGTMINQGYIAPAGANVLFPSIGVTSSGQGAIAFTLSGPNNFPSAAYVTVDATNGAGPIHIIGPGALPEDGFSGYIAFGNPDRVARWGDYSAAVADGAGHVWMANEYIGNFPRTVNANWNTFIAEVTP